MAATSSGEYNEGDTSTSEYYEGNDDTLIFAHVLFRHGARNIVAAYPNSPNNNESQWPGGFGQLTNEGKLQLYKLGQYLRRRYNHLINETYSQNDIYVKSTDIDRTLMSAQACLAGLHPPTDGEKFDPDIKWQPIPVHTIPLELDELLCTGVRCPVLKYAHAEYMRTDPEMVRIHDENADLFKQWSTLSGLKFNQSFHDTHLLYNTLSIEKHQKKPLPEWAEEALQQANGRMQYLANMNFKSYSATPQLAKLKQGFLIREIMQRFEQKMQGILYPDRKLWLYSAHDLTIAGVLIPLKLFELHFPPYASSLHFELFRPDSGEHYFQIFYRRNGEEYPKAMNIPGCGTKCSVKQFMDLFDEIMPGGFEAECKLPPGAAQWAPGYDDEVDFLDLL